MLLTGHLRIHPTEGSERLEKIEKTVDKTLYNLSFKEDCLVC
jgi:hypothetical protein